MIFCREVDSFKKKERKMIVLKMISPFSGPTQPMKPAPGPAAGPRPWSFGPVRQLLQPARPNSPDPPEPAPRVPARPVIHLLQPELHRPNPGSAAHNRSQPLAHPLKPNYKKSASGPCSNRSFSPILEPETRKKIGKCHFSQNRDKVKENQIFSKSFHSKLNFLFPIYFHLSQLS